MTTNELFGATLRGDQQNLCKTAANMIRNGFTWSLSPQGHGFWDEVCEALEAFAYAKKPDNTLEGLAARVAELEAKCAGK